MGTLTLSQLRDEVRFDLKNRPDTGTTGLSDTRLDLFLNAAYLQVAHPSVHRHRELMYTYTLTLATADNDYTFTPVGGVVILAIRSVTHIDAAVLSATAARQKLRAKDPQWFDERTINSGSRPSSYAVEGNSILIEPVPDSSLNGELLQVRAIREPAQLAAAGDTTVIGNRWDEVILLGARWRAELHLGYRDLAEATKIDFASLVNEYRDFDHLHGLEEWDWTSEVRTESHMETV
jgi:hypothetical protein